MSRYIFKIFFTVFIMTALYSTTMAQSVVLNYFNVRSMGANVQVSWEIQDEAGISEFRLYRKYKDETDYSYLSTVHANGGKNYEYIDDELFKDEDKTITYELRVVKGGSTHNFYVTLSHNPTSIQRTWGSIKSMFK